MSKTEKATEVAKSNPIDKDTENVSNIQAFDALIDVYREKCAKRCKVCITM